MKKLRINQQMVALPLALWLSFFVVIPLGLITVFSFLSKGTYGGVVWTFTTDHYLRIFDQVYIPIYLKSFRFAATATLACLILGYPTAYVIASAPKKWRQILAALILLPFLANFIVRAYAIRVLLSQDGPLNAGLIALGLIQSPLSMNDSQFAVWLGMVTNYLPFMVLPIYLVIERLDFTLIDAASDLGARGPALYLKVFFPLTLPGIISGSVLVFVPLLGEFMIPDILGGARTMLLGNLITDQFLKSRNWPFGAALTMFLVLFMTIAFMLEYRFIHKQKRS